MPTIPPRPQILKLPQHSVYFFARSHLCWYPLSRNKQWNLLYNIPFSHLLNCITLSSQENVEFIGWCDINLILEWCLIISISHIYWVIRWLIMLDSRSLHSNAQVTPRARSKPLVISSWLHQSGKVERHDVTDIVRNRTRRVFPK